MYIKHLITKVSSLQDVRFEGGGGGQEKHHACYFPTELLPTIMDRGPSSSAKEKLI